MNTRDHSIHITTDGNTATATIEQNNTEYKVSTEFACYKSVKAATQAALDKAWNLANGKYTVRSVREVKRPAKVGEWVRFVKDHGGELTPGSIHRVESERDGTLFFHGGFRGYVCSDHDKYVVLEGYTPEPEKPAFRPYLDCDGDHYGYIGEATEYKDAVGRPLAVGDEVELYRNGDMRGKYSVVCPQDPSSYDYNKPFVMSIQAACDGKEVSLGFKIIKARSYDKISHGEQIDSIKYIKEKP